MLAPFNTKWRKVSVEDERKIPHDRRYVEFQATLRNIPKLDFGPDMFPRPITGETVQSYGIITVFDAGNAFEYYATQMRTTFEFAEYVKCGPRNENLYEYLCSMTTEERELLLKGDMNKIWDDLLLEEEIFFHETKKRVMLVHEHYAPYLPQLLQLTESYTGELPWVFPKGRQKKRDRTLLAAAIREMKEEGKIEFGELVLMYDKPVTVVHRGTDNCVYSTTYYVIKAEKRYEPPQIHLENNLLGEYCLSIDMKDYSWVSIPKTEPPQGFKIDLNMSSKLAYALLKVHRELISNS